MELLSVIRRWHDREHKRVKLQAAHTKLAHSRAFVSNRPA